MAAHHSYSQSSIVYPASTSSSSAADNDSTTAHSSTYLDYRSSIDTIPSRPISHHASSSRASLRSGSRKGLPLPSYMTNYQNGTAKANPVTIPARVPAPPPVRRPIARKGTIIIAVAAEPSTATMFYLEILLRRHAYAGIAIVGVEEHAAAIKQLKIDVYAITGQLKQELSISMHIHPSWEAEETNTALEQMASADGDEKLGAVMCTPQYDGMGPDLMSLDHRDFARSWQRSVGFVHAMTKWCIPPLSAGGEERAAVFAVLASPAHSPAALVNKAATNTLLRQLETSYASARGLAIGHAEQLLVPEPAPVEEAALVVSNAMEGPSTDATLKPPDSPTKLWNIWALQDELGGA